MHTLETLLIKLEQRIKHCEDFKKVKDPDYIAHLNAKVIAFEECKVMVQHVINNS